MRPRHSSLHTTFPGGRLASPTPSTPHTWMLPPASSVSSPAAISCCRTRCGCALGASHFVMATTMGQPAARACEMASRVCRVVVVVVVVVSSHGPEGWWWGRAVDGGQLC